MQAYVIYYAVSNFFIPFVVLLFCYSKMCAVLWGNFKQKKEQQEQQANASPPSHPSPTVIKRSVSINGNQRKVITREHFHFPQDGQDSPQRQSSFENIELEVISQQNQSQSQRHQEQQTEKQILRQNSSNSTECSTTLTAASSLKRKVSTNSGGAHNITINHGK